MQKVTAVVTAIAIACSGLTGCATASKDIATSSVSPLQYQPYDCEMLSVESQRLSSRVTELGGRLDTAASNDKAIAGVGIILFWPALFLLGGNKGNEADYARLKGEVDALNTAALLKKCGMAMQPAGTQPALKGAAGVVAPPEPYVVRSGCCG